MNAKRFAYTVAILVVIGGCQAIFPLFPDRITRLFTEGALGEGEASIGTFEAIQIDPGSEDSAGPMFVAVGDLDNDGMLDVATAWNQSKPVQMHFQRRVNMTTVFETITLVGDFPINIISGLAVADMDGDDLNDVVVQVKDSGVFARCRLTGETLDAEDAPAGRIVIYFAPDDADNFNNALAWEEVTLSQTDTAGASPADQNEPEAGGFTDMVLGDIDGQNGLDIVVAWNANDCEGGGNQVEYYTNPGPATARQSNAWASFLVDIDAPPVKSVGVADIDRDGDNDIVATYPNARGQNVRWYRNPTIDVPDVFHLSDGTWQRGTIGEVSPGADVVELGDIDGDDIVDVVVRSSVGMVIVWFKGPVNPTTDPIRGVPWQVFSIAEFNDRMPRAITLADADSDGQVELLASAEGAVLTLAPFAEDAVYDHWDESLVFDDFASTAPTVTDPNVDPSEVSATSTFINSVVVADLDDDSLVDFIATLDRRDQSGITNDAVIWFRKTSE